MVLESPAPPDPDARRTGLVTVTVIIPTLVSGVYVAPGYDGRKLSRVFVCWYDHVLPTPVGYPVTRSMPGPGPVELLVQPARRITSTMPTDVKIRMTFSGIEVIVVSPALLFEIGMVPGISSCEGGGREGVEGISLIARIGHDAIMTMN